MQSISSNRSRRRAPRFALLLLICWGWLLLPLTAAVRLAPVFADHAVLQRDQPLAIWGQADPGEKIAVRFRERTAATQAGADGAWRVTFAPFAASTEPAELVVQGNNTVVCRDVLVGDVWWCSGQSNMEFAVATARDSAREIAGASWPLIRHIKIKRQLADTPRTEVTATPWQPATPEHVGKFTAAGYFFAREVHRHIGVPIGILNCTWSGTPIEPWMNAEALAGDPAFAVVGERWRADLAAYPERRAKFEQTLADWRKQEEAAKTQGAEAHAKFLRDQRAPRPPIGAPDHPYPSNPSAIFNGMVHPLRQLTIKGVLWYQGEGNAVRAPEYAALFQAHIRDWRRVFAQPALPFYWVQIANYRVNTDWPRLREAQSRALALPNTGQAVTIDIGDPDDIHPTNKQEVGRRLALIALAQLYGGTAEYSGPTMRAAHPRDAAIEVVFEHAAGLHARDGKIGRLELAGADRIFHPAEGRIAGETLLVTSPKVSHPVAVRYAWHSAPETGLCNAAGLPAAPFRSDDW
ncbi:MAG: sialate O-acetylesterase [Opitutae bacterium]|nr:sialate O-acetylesterase [Opitutae bacterium]